MVGFVPMFGASTVPADTFERYPEFNRRREWFIEHRPDLVDERRADGRPRAPTTTVDPRPRASRTSCGACWPYMLDEDEFLSPYGVRSVSRYHLDHPLVLQLDGQEYRLDYEPGESTTDLFGGNSNWRGPIWMPVNFLIIGAASSTTSTTATTFTGRVPDRLGPTDEPGARSRRS